MFGSMMVDWEERIDMRRMREERCAKAQQALKEAGVDALFVFQYEDVRYITGHRTHMGPTFFFGLAVCVLTQDDPPFLYTMDELHSRKRATWLQDKQIRTAPALGDERGIREWCADAKSLLGSKVKGKIGVDIWTPDLMRILPDEFPDADFVDGVKVLRKAKMIKTKDELNCIKMAYAFTDAAMAEALNFLKPGVKECEVLATAWHKMTALGSEWTQCSNIVCSGPYGAPYRRFTSDRIIKEGDMVIIDIGGCFNGYWADFTRTYLCGNNIDPTPRQRELHQEAYDALWACIEASQPGNTNLDVVAACPEKNNLGGVLGHGSGLACWELPGINSSYGEAVTLVPGMYFSLEPYAGDPQLGYGVRLENNVIVNRQHRVEEVRQARSSLIKRVPRTVLGLLTRAGILRLVDTRMKLGV